MGLQETPSGARTHIGFFGLRNVGKSSLVNAVTGQALSVVSDVAGTTTDPVQKAMELLPLGPVVILDTPGLDDTGTLGELRIAQTRKALRKTDLAVLVTDATRALLPEETELLSCFAEQELPYLIARNKADLLDAVPAATENELYVSARTGAGMDALKEALGRLGKSVTHARPLLSDLISAGDTVVLVVPIDESAPKGRLILPQQQTMREILDCHACFLTCQDTELSEALKKLSAPPKLVITDSQAFARVSQIVPESVPLTSFSILFARYKGSLPALLRGAAVLSRLHGTDRVLIAEGCTHHRQCNDIGTVKLPHMIARHAGVTPEFSFVSGGDFPEDLSPYSLIVHCGGCMLNEREMKSRIARAKAAGVPLVNYGIAIAEMTGILQRALAPFPDSLKGDPVL